MGLRASPSTAAARSICDGDGASGRGTLMSRGDRSVRCCHHLDVLGYGEVDSARALGLRQLEGLADHLGHGRGGQDEISPLGHRREHRHQVDALVGLLVDPVQPDLGRQGHHRRAVGSRVGCPQQEVDGTRAECRRAHTRAPGQAAEDLGHERRRLLMADQDITDGRPGQRIGEVDVLLTGDPEHASDALVLKAAHKQVSDPSLIHNHVRSVPESPGKMLIASSSGAVAWRRPARSARPARPRGAW